MIGIVYNDKEMKDLLCVTLELCAVGNKMFTSPTMETGRDNRASCLYMLVLISHRHTKQDLQELSEPWSSCFRVSPCTTSQTVITDIKKKELAWPHHITRYLRCVSRTQRQPGIRKRTAPRELEQLRQEYSQAIMSGAAPCNII